MLNCILVIKIWFLESSFFASLIPVIVEAKPEFKIVQHETFAPVLYLLKYSGNVENAIAIQNEVAQGLSSAIMTNNL